MNYTLYLNNPAQVSLYKSPMTPAAIEESIKEKSNPEKELMADARLRRLTMRLLQAFPFEDHRDLWLERHPAEEIEKITNGLWKLEIAQDKAEVFLRVLLPLIRQLWIGVYLVQDKTYAYHDLPGSDFQVVYPASSLSFYQTLDPDYKHEYKKAELRKRLLERLTPILEAHGFKRKVHRGYSWYFTYSQGGTEQEISGNIKYSYDKYKADWLFKVKSLRYGHLMREIYQKIHNVELTDPVQPSTATRFEFHHLGNTEHLVKDELMRSPEEIDWMVDHVAATAVPILVQMRTIKTMDWLLNSPESNLSELSNISQAVDLKLIGLWVAKLMGNPVFEENLVKLLKRKISFIFYEINREEDADIKEPVFDYEVEDKAILIKEILTYIESFPRYCKSFRFEKTRIDFSLASHIYTHVTEEDDGSF